MILINYHRLISGIIIENSEGGEGGGGVGH